MKKHISYVLLLSLSFTNMHSMLEPISEDSIDAQELETYNADFTPYYQSTRPPKRLGDLVYAYPKEYVPPKKIRFTCSPTIKKTCTIFGQVIGVFALTILIGAIFGIFASMRS